jgi:hypothetical protein
MSMNKKEVQHSLQQHMCSLERGGRRRRKRNKHHPNERMREFTKIYFFFEAH